MSEASVTPMPAVGLRKLREKFADGVVGKLPRLTCKACSDRSQNCQTHKKQKCAECGNFISTAHIHLDYVGHAEVTDRLLTVDEQWSWEPFAVDDRGLPVIAKGAGGELTLWIRLTVLGVTRVGVGSVAANAFDAEKQLIGDALRNAAMRFGVALDLWSKEELESTLEAAPTTSTSPVRVDPQTGEVSGGDFGPEPPPPVTRRPPPGRRGKEAPKAPEASNNDRDGTVAGVESATIPASPAALEAIRRLAEHKGLNAGELRKVAGKELEKLSVDDANVVLGKLRDAEGSA